MLWNQRYRLNSYIKSSLWIVPFIALLLYAATIRVLSPLELLVSMGAVALEPVRNTDCP